jgi:hypothetical protein
MAEHQAICQAMQITLVVWPHDSESRIVVIICLKSRAPSDVTFSWQQNTNDISATVLSELGEELAAEQGMPQPLKCCHGDRRSTAGETIGSCVVRIFLASSRSSTLSSPC